MVQSIFIMFSNICLKKNKTKKISLILLKVFEILNEKNIGLN